ncbi:PaaI family thioesterase [Desulforamulus ferrireducens]|uniref:Thioesterase n=1 Tax=Desulforamulus ferrireducens TaxID=1833852 RepID=A0A1S6J0B0_9FIRM|nr:PaaI family thioesterase [Desulforamulus ferrireducens]AQS60459.1 thioesterase [Desulforamulus ferrireducens]
MDTETKQMIEFADNNPFAKAVDIKVTELELGSGRASVEVTVTAKHLNPHGTLHGGVLSTMADIAMGLAVRTLGKLGVTVNLNLNYLAPGYLGEKIVARGEVVHRGNTLLSTECTIARDDQVLARATGLWFVVKT